MADTCLDKMAGVCPDKMVDNDELNDIRLQSKQNGVGHMNCETLRSRIKMENARVNKIETLIQTKWRTSVERKRLIARNSDHMKFAIIDSSGERAQN